MKKTLYIMLFFFSLNIASAIETKIIYKIQDEIITNIDIKNEFKYLLALNNKLKNLNEEKIFLISKESIIKEKIKKIEVSKNFQNLEINERYTDALLKNIYSSLNLKSLDEFSLYLKPYNLNLEDIRKKIVIDALWNELVIRKYDSKIEIDEQKLKKILMKNKKDKTKEYHLSEIVYEVKNKNDIDQKYQKIKKSISEIGFENSAAIYSISKTSKIGGNIGWIPEKLLSVEILQNISKLNMNNISKPIIISGGILILKVKETKEIVTEIDYDKELKKLISYERNTKLNQYSKIYFNKIKKNIGFNE